MNKKIFFVVLILSLAFSFLIYKNYSADTDEYKSVYLIQVGAYKDYNNAVLASNNYSNSIIRKEGELYKIFIGATRNEDVYKKIVKIYLKEDNTFMKEIRISDKAFLNNLDSYDSIIKNTTNEKNVDIALKAGLSELKKIIK